MPATLDFPPQRQKPQDKPRPTCQAPGTASGAPPLLLPISHPSLARSLLGTPSPSSGSRDLARDLSGEIRPPTPEGRASLRSFKEKYTNIFIKKYKLISQLGPNQKKAELSNGHWEGASVKAIHFVVKGNGWRRGCRAGPRGGGSADACAAGRLCPSVCLSICAPHSTELTASGHRPGRGSPGSARDARVEGGPAAGPASSCTDTPSPPTTARPGPPRPGFPAPGDGGDDITEHSGVLWCIYCRVSSSSNSCYPGPPRPTRLPFWRPDDQRCPCRSPDSPTLAQVYTEQEARKRPQDWVVGGATHCAPLPLRPRRELSPG